MNNHFTIFKCSTAATFFTFLLTFYTFNNRGIPRRTDHIAGFAFYKNPGITGSDQKLYCGGTHTLAIKYDSTLLVWGSNNQGQLGNGGFGQSLYPLLVSGMTGITDAAGGFEHSIALRKDGKVWSWGRNTEGQLGDSTTTQRITPVQVPGLSNVKKLAAGYYHSLAVRSDGTVWAWGKNNFGQLGNGTNVNSTKAVQVTAISGVIATAGGEGHSIALKNDGTVWAWGYNVAGQLGDGTTIHRNKPVQVSGGFTAVSIAAGRLHTLAIKADGTVWAWGQNTYGQLGIGNTISPKQVPVQVINLSNIIAIAAGEHHSLAVKSDGTVWAWGFNDEGQLGIGTIDEDKHTIPVQTGRVNSGTSVSAGPNYSMAAESDGNAWGWGSNSSGQLGDGTSSNSYIPVPSLFNFNTLSPQAALPVLSPDGGAYIVSQNVTVSCPTAGAELHYTTNGIDPTKNDPVIVSGSSLNISNGITLLKVCAFKSGLAPSDIKGGAYQVGERAIAGYAYSMAIRSDNKLWLWGSNTLAGTPSQKPIPFRVDSLGSVKDAAGGFGHTIVLKNNGTAWAWGNNLQGQLGDGTFVSKTTPVQVTGLGNVVNVTSGYNHSLAIKSDGSVWAWGLNTFGQLGNGTTSNSSTAIKVTTVIGAIDMAAGTGFSIILKADGTIWGCGQNQYGQLGNGTVIQQNTPVQAGVGFKAIAIAAGANHVLALKTDGTVWGWGLNINGQLGNGNSTSQSNPVQVINLTNVIAIAAGDYHSLAVKSDGTVWAWGRNDAGQLGDLTFTNRATAPIQVRAIGNISSISASGHTLVFTQTSEAHLFWAFGNNNSWQLGDSTQINKNFRVLVHFPIDEDDNGVADWKDLEFLNTEYSDKDRDGLLDWKEAMIYGTDPGNFDTNDDGLSDGANVLVGLQPRATDTDKDGISNVQENKNGTSPILADTDGDGVPDKSDAFPLDRFLTKKPPPNGSDHTPPVITLQEPF